MIDLLQELATRQMENISSTARLVIAHPNYTYQHRLLHLVLQDSSSVYVRCEGDQLTAEQLRQQLDSALEQQQGDLKRAAVIALDEADRALPEALEAFVTDLLNRSTGRIVVVTRRMPEFIYRRPEIRAQTVFVPVDKALMLPDYANQEDNTYLLEVRALGSGRVMLNGRNVDNWDGTLPRALFFYLVDRGMTTRSQIFETFWPNLPTREATNVFHVTKRKISEVLGVDLTVYWSGFYRIAPNIDLLYDSALFNEMVQDSAVAEPEEATRLLTYATTLYRGEFLSSIDMDWAEKRRQEITQNYGEALIGLGKLMEQSGRLEESLGLYVRASATNPQREDLARSIMLLYRQLGMRDDAIATYRRLEAELENSLGVSPARNLQELLAEIQAEAERVL
ncbi:MAG: hypothetical protein HZC41_15175 [Chloroflexi bacterium]|nr:hypothetical protein [Chloroflexota bacterium]